MVLFDENRQLKTFRFGDLPEDKELPSFLANMAISILAEEYTSGGTGIISVNSSVSSRNEDFWKTPNIIIDGGIGRINIYLSISPPSPLSWDGMTESLFNKCYSKLAYANIPENEFARLVIPSFWCFETNSRTNLQISGGTFSVKYDFHSLIADDANKKQKKGFFQSELSEDDILNKFSSCWEKLDYKIIEPYLDRDFHYISDWIFDELCGKSEYLIYLKRKLETLKKNGTQICCKPVLIEQLECKPEKALLFNQAGEMALFIIQVEDGFIKRARMGNLSFFPHVKIKEITSKDQK